MYRVIWDVWVVRDHGFSSADFIEDLLQGGLTYGVLLDIHGFFLQRIINLIKEYYYILLKLSKDLPQLQILINTKSEEALKMLNHPTFPEFLLYLLSDLLTHFLIERKLGKNLHWDRFILLKLFFNKLTGKL